MKTRLSLLIPALLSLPLLAQEPVAAPEPTPAPAPQIDLAAQTKQMDELQATNQKQNLVLEGLSEQINSQRTLLQDSQSAIQEQNVLYAQCQQDMKKLAKELNAALIANAQLKEMMGNFDKSLSLSDGEAARKSEKLDAFILEFNRQAQKLQAQEKWLNTLHASINSYQEASKLELDQARSALEKSAADITMLTADLQEIKFNMTAQAKLAEDQVARLALELAQTKLEMADYKKLQAMEQEKLIASMAAGMILLFLCLVTIVFIQFTNNKRLKNNILLGVSAKLKAASDEIRQMTKQPSKPNKPAPKPRKQR